MNISLDDYPSLVLFARVVHHRSFSLAAREAGIAKSAVSRRIARLEEILGVRLLHRSTRAVAATAEGLRVYEYAAALVAAGVAAGDAAGGTGGEIRGTLRINAPIPLAQLHLGRVVSAFLARHPAVEAELSTDDRRVSVVDGGYDVVLRIGRLQDSSLVARKLASDRLVICGSPEYLAARGEPRTPGDLVHHECLQYALVPRAAEWRCRGVEGPFARQRFVSTDSGVLREAALAGLGLAVFPSFIVAREVAEGRLRLVLEEGRRAAVGIYAITAHRTLAPPRVRAFIDFVASYFAARDWQHGPPDSLRVLSSRAGRA